MSGALAGLLAATFGAAGGGGSTPTAPALVGSAVGAFTSGVTDDITRTLTGAVSGNTVVVIAAMYKDATVIDPTVTSPGYTFTARGALATAAADLTLKAFTAPVPSNGNPVFTISNAADYKSIVVLQLEHNHSDIVDVSPVSDGHPTLSGISAAPLGLTLATTTYTHDFILLAVTWYDSGRIHTIDAAWPQLFAWNAGETDRNQIIVVGKAVTSTGDYSPFITAGTPGTDFAAVAIAFKGKEV